MDLIRIVGGAPGGGLGLVDGLGAWFGLGSNPIPPDDGGGGMLIAGVIAGADAIDEVFIPGRGGGGRGRLRLRADGPEGSE